MKNFLNKHKIPLMLFIVCLVIAVFSKYYLTIINNQFSIFNPPAGGPITNYGITDNRYQIADSNEESKNQPSSRAQVEGESEKTKNQLPITNYELPITNYQLPTTSSSTIASPVIPHPEPEFVNSVTLTVNGEEYKVELRNNMTVYDLMGALAVSSIKPFIFSAKEFSGMGYFVESINGIDNNANNSGKYWIYYLNGESAKVGISNYILKPNDLIEWKYENSNL